MNDLNTTKRIMALWGLELLRIHDELEIAGSPERSLERVVVEDKNKKRYVLESVSAKDLPRKQKIAEDLTFIRDQGVRLIHPCLRNRDNAYHSQYDGIFYQLSPYIEGVPLVRPEYTRAEWRGRALARFLIDFYHKTEGTRLSTEKGDVFSITGYIRKIEGEIAVHNPELKDRVAPVITCLERDFFMGHDTIPVRFCHGDYHVLNVIWSDHGLNGVIDWEFCGIKPEIYDVANMLGCIGIEDPNALAGPLVSAFLETLTRAAVISKTGWRRLGEFIIALRFAWLAEWLRRKDHPMIELELTYMNLLADNIDHLFR